MKALALACLALTVAASAGADTATLREAFPAHRSVPVTVTIVDRRDSEGRPTKTRRDKIIVEVPPRAMWEWYHRVIQHTTVENFAERHPAIERQIQADLTALDRLGGSQSAEKQAELGRAWLRVTLRGYLKRWEKAAGGG